ncbi:MAG: transporter [Chlorobi bacterium]|nr:transporter [Chlorobiota bacterium]
MKKKLLLFVLSLSMLPAFAGGYRVALQGARMLGMAHAGTAMFTGAEALFFNPAGSAFLQGNVNAAFGLSVVKSTVKYQNAEYLWTAKTQNPLGTPFYAYLTWKHNDRLSFGFALYTPFGSSLKWEEGWAGAHLVNSIKLTAVYFQPTLTWKMNDYVALSAGFIAAWGSVVYNKDLNRFMRNEEGEKTDITLTAKNISSSGYVLSAAFKPADWVSMGVTYRSKVVFRARKGKAEINDAPAFFTHTADAFRASLPMPAELSTGVAVKPFKQLTLAFDYNYTWWSIYESLDIDFANHFPDNRMPKKWQNTSTYRIGAEYAFSENLDLRVGYYSDQSPIPPTYFSPETPTADSDGYTFGFTYRHGRYAFDFAFLYVKGHERTDSYDYYVEGLSAPRFDGTYVSNALVPSFGLQIQL